MKRKPRRWIVLIKRLPVAIVADRLPRGVDAAAQCGLRHDPSVPDGIQQLVLADDAVAVAYQVHQQVVHLRLDVNDLTGTPQLLTTQVDLMAGKDETHGCPSLTNTVVFLARSSGGQNVV